MGCKASAIRAEGSTGTYAQDGKRESPSPSPSKVKLTRNSSQTSAGPTPEATQRGNSGLQDHAASGQRRSSRSSMPTSPRRSSVSTVHDNAASSEPPPPPQQQAVTYPQDDDPFAPPPPLPPEYAAKSDSVLTVHVGSTSEDDNNDDDSNMSNSSQDGVGGHENHFDPIPMPEPAQVESRGTDSKDRGPPRLPSAESRTISKDATGTFRTAITDHDKTDSAQAAKEYQQRVEAKRTAEEVHTKRRQLEEFDPVRPVDSFNVTHRGLLGRCYDRRAPELIPVSFVHAIAKAIGVDESHPASTTTVSHMSGGDEFPPGSPIQHLARLSRQSGHRGSTGATTAAAVTGSSSSQWTGVGGRRVPRRSHWFNVGGISTDGFAPAAVEPFYVSSAASSSAASRSSTAATAGPTLVFPNSVAIGGRMALGNESIHIILKPSSSTTAAAGVGETAKGSLKKTGTAAGSTELDIAADDATASLVAKTLTADQVKALPWETREKYFNLMLSRNSRFMGIKDVFAFKLGSGVSTDRSVRFLRKRNLEPAPGVTAVRWNRVEFFHPSLHTLVRAVAKTQGMSVELSQVEQASVSATGIEGSNSSPPGLSANGSPNRTGSAVAPISSGESVAATDGLGAASPNSLHRSFSQFVMGHVENRSFSRANGGWADQNRSFVNNNNITVLRKNSGSAASGNDKADEHHGLRGGGGVDPPPRFPEDSVLALALGLPYSRLGQLSGVPASVRSAALSNAGRLGGSLMFPIATGLGSRRATRDMMLNNGAATSTTGAAAALPTAASGTYAPLRGSVFPALRPSSNSVLVALSISCFSVSINPFEWQERHYTRFPVDIDGSKHSSRSTYGEGVVTDVMYGGLMVVECSSMEAVKELQGLLTSMTWTKERSLRGIIKDVRKHLKKMHSNLHRPRQAASSATHGRATSEDGSAATAAQDWSKQRYRIIRRIGGRPMRDAVELEEISVFFDEDEEVREERTTLHQPDRNRKTPSALSQGLAPITEGGNNGAGAALPLSLALDKSPPETRAGSSPNGPDPDITSSFSRVASAWFGLPVISAVLRAWALHLLACPEYAQPTAMYLQKHAGLAPVLQLTALSSFYHEGNTPSDDGAAANDPDYLFFESDGTGYDGAQQNAVDAAATQHPQPVPRIPRYNCFYASSTDRDDDAEEATQSAATQVARGGKAETKGEQGTGSPESKPGDKDVAAASSPMKASSATPDESATAQKTQSGDGIGRGHLRVRDPLPQEHTDHHSQHHDDNDDESVGLQNCRQTTVEGEGWGHLMDSGSSTHSALLGGRQSTAVMSSPHNSVHAKVGAAETEGRAGSPASPTKRTAPKSTSSAPPKKVAATRPSSPLSPGGATGLNSSHHASSASAASSSSSFETSSSSPTRHSTLVYHLNNSLPGSTMTDRSTVSNTTLGRHAAAPLASDGLGGSPSTSAVSAMAGGVADHAPSHIAVPPSDIMTTMTNNDDVLSPSRDASMLTTLSKSGSPQLFVPTPQLGSSSSREDTGFELVAMARTVGPEDSLAAQEAQRRRESAKANAETPLGPRGALHLTPASSPAPSPHQQAGASNGAASDAATDAATAKPSTSKSSAGTKVRKSKPKLKKKTTKSKAKKAATPVNAKKAKTRATDKGTETDSAAKTKKDTSAASASAPVSTTSTTPTETAQRHSSVDGAPTAVTVAVGSTQPVPEMGDTAESTMRPIDTPTGAAGRTRLPDTPTGFSRATTEAPGAFLTDRVTVDSVASAAAPNPPSDKEAEAEGLWYMTMLEVKARRQELEELRQARRNAEDHRQKQQDELRALNRIFLPHGHPQDLDCTLLYLKTALFEPDDIPHGRLFLQQPDWLPLLAAVWTSPANRIRAVEVAAELTWMDIPRLGLLAGLLYHHNASGPLEELIIRSNRLLGAPRQPHLPNNGDDDDDDDNNNDTTAGGRAGGGGRLLAKVRRQKAKRDKMNDSADVSNASLSFVTELDRTGSGFGPGCPPFFIAPEEARDTLWLLLCAVATNTMTTNFRVVLKGLPAQDTAGAGSSGGGGGGVADHERTPSGTLPFFSFFSPYRRDEHAEEPLLLESASMLLDSFVVQPTLHDGDGSDGSSVKNYSLFKAVLPLQAGSGNSCNNNHKNNVAGNSFTAQSMSHNNNNTFDEAGLLSAAAESPRFDSPHRLGNSTNSPERHDPQVSRQPSSLIIVTSSAGNLTSQDPLAADESPGSGSFSPNRHHRRPLSTLLTLRPTVAASRSGASSGASSLPPKASTPTVPTHHHHVKPRSWARDGVEVEERPFYEVLMHRCRQIEEARDAAANSGDPSLIASPCISHYHHSFNATHNDARFYVPMERQAKLQAAVKRAVAVANGEIAPQDVEDSVAVYSSKGSLTKTGQQQQSSEHARTPSPTPPPLVPCPPPLLFCQTNMVFGLESAEEEAKVLLCEERRLRDRAPEIREALRKSVKHYNQAQQEARHKAMKGGGSKSASSPPPVRLITLEF